jgi:hypothetical protein
MRLCSSLSFGEGIVIGKEISMVFYCTIAACFYLTISQSVLPGQDNPSSSPVLLIMTCLISIASSVS